MANKKIWLGMLIIALTFGMMVVGCEEDEEESPSPPPQDTWTAVTSLTQGVGTWKGSYTDTQSQNGITITTKFEQTMTITASNATTGTVSSSMTMTTSLSGSGIYLESAWAEMKSELPDDLVGSGIVVNETTHTITMTTTSPAESINISDMPNGVQINQNGTKLKIPADDGSPEMIFIKQ